MADTDKIRIVEGQILLNDGSIVFNNECCCDQCDYCTGTTPKYYLATFSFSSSLPLRMCQCEGAYQVRLDRTADCIWFALLDPDQFQWHECGVDGGVTLKLEILSGKFRVTLTVVEPGFGEPEKEWQRITWEKSVTTPFACATTPLSVSGGDVIDNETGQYGLWVDPIVGERYVCGTIDSGWLNATTISLAPQGSIPPTPENLDNRYPYLCDCATRGLFYEALVEGVSFGNGEQCEDCSALPEEYLLDLCDCPTTNPLSNGCGPGWHFEEQFVVSCGAALVTWSIGPTWDGNGDLQLLVRLTIVLGNLGIVDAFWLGNPVELPIDCEENEEVEITCVPYILPWINNENYCPLTQQNITVTLRALG